MIGVENRNHVFEFECLNDKVLVDLLECEEKETTHSGARHLDKRLGSSSAFINSSLDFLIFDQY